MLSDNDSSDNDEKMLRNSTVPELSNDSKIILNTMSAEFSKLTATMQQLTDFCGAASKKFTAYDEKFVNVDSEISKHEVRINDLNINLIKNKNDQTELFARFEERLSQLEAKSFESIDKLDDDEEYVAMLGRTEDTRRKVDRIKNKIEVLITEDNLSGLRLDGSEFTKFSSTIDPAKLASLFRTTFNKSMTVSHCQKTFIRGKKHVCIATMKFASDVADMLKVRNKFKATADSTKNNSIQRPLDKESQKVYAHLIDLVKSNKLKEVSISKAGFMCISVGDTFRLILDPNEAWYIKRNGGISEEDLKNLKNGIKFVTSARKLVNVPARYLREY